MNPCFFKVLPRIKLLVILGLDPRALFSYLVLHLLEFKGSCYGVLASKASAILSILEEMDGL